MNRPGPTVEDLQLRLAQDEEWLKDFQESLNRSATLTTSVSTILDDFRDRITGLSNNVSSLYSKTSVVQREQQNVKKLLSIVDATIQFHGKTMDFENTIRDGNLLHNLEEYLEKMNNLKEAISFFSSHSTYKSQFNHMKQIFETGCGYLEAEFGNQVKSKSLSLDPAKIFECLDDEYEMPSFRLPNLATLKDPQKLNTMASWLLANSASCTQFLTYYAGCRSENMLKTLKAINEHRANQRLSKSKFVKTALKKAAGKITDKGSPSLYTVTNEIMDSKKIHGPQQDTPISPVLFTLSALLILVQLETEACAAVFSNVKVEASVLRQVVVNPLSTSMLHNLKVVDSFEGEFEVIMPLTKFLMKHTNQLRSLCENIGEGETFARFRAAVNRRSVQLISEFVDHLTNDHDRFVPMDGNVHSVTSRTINFLKLLAQNKPLVGYIYEQDAGAQPGASSAKMNLSKLFAQILSALGVNLRNKSGTYSDSALGSLFMFNNLSYIKLCCVKDKNLMSILNANNDGQLLSFYESEIDEYLHRYLQSWTRVTAVFSATNHSDERKSAKSIYSNFNKEFDSVIDAQKSYCLVDLSLAHDIRKKIKDLVLKPYSDFTSRESSQFTELELDRQLKYDSESVELIIDRLFDVAY